MIVDTVSMTASDPGTRPHSLPRFDGIDLLRGLSILLVLMNHVNMRLLFAHVPYTKGLPSQLVDSLVWSGQFGVQIFFVISGYLITSTSIRRWGGPNALSIRDFYTLRFTRIAPLMLLLLTVLCTLHMAHVPDYVVSAKTGGLRRALLAALTSHINFLEATRGYLPGNWDILWSLSVEETFYLFFPLVARLFRRKSFLIPLLLLFAIAGPFARARAFNPNPVWREYSYLGGMDAIALGCLTAILLFSVRLSRRWITSLGICGLAILGFSLCFSDYAYKWGLGRDGLNMTILAIGTCLLITVSTQSSWRAPRVFTPLLVLGKHSYEVYLTHMFAVMALFAAFVHFGKPVSVVPVLFAGAIVLAGLLGWAVAVLFAEPINLFLRKRAGVDRTHFGAATPEVN